MKQLFKRLFKYNAPIIIKNLTNFFINRTVPEKEMKQVLIETANISSKMKVLGFGCGTATLTIMVKELHPAAKVTSVHVTEKS